MDIGNNLSYNGDTVHSGSFLEELKAFGKEIMHNKGNRISKRNMTEAGERKLWGSVRISALFICVMLCGCTRREQLVLETGGDAGLSGTVSEGMQEDEGSLNPPSEQILPEPDGSRKNADQYAAEMTAVEQILPEEQTICVHVCGAVKNPDVYELPAGSRVYEAVKMAGGFTEEADEGYVNQAQALSDGVKLVIPTVGQTQVSAQEELEGRIGVVGTTETETGAGGISTAAEVSAGRININTATQEQLCEIPGIGATRAAAIVSYRQEHGGFTKIEDIMNVSGIKEGTYVKIKDSITVN